MFLTMTHLPGVMVLASPQYFTRPGAGINATPLDVLSFASPAFGDVGDAVNLLSGNVYLDLGALNRNNTFQTGDDSGGAFGNFKTNGVQRLAGFTRTLTAAPTEWSLGQGDGAFQVYRQATSAEITAAPSWIVDRYAGITSNVTYYVTKPRDGTAIQQEWIVTVRLGNKHYISHHYDLNGNRTTFYDDGEYADYSQNPYEQFRSAKYGTDAHGISTPNARTEYTYTALNTGKVTSVKDSFGRVTTYDWALNGTLSAVNILLQDPNNSASWARRIEYAYTTVGGQNVVNSLAFRTHDGRGNTIGRWFGFTYTTQNNQVLLQTVSRPMLASGAEGNMGLTAHTTQYTYQADNRVSTIQETNLPNTVFTYGTSSAAQGAGGLKVTRTQGDKRTVYEYTPEGWLRNLRERNYNAPGGEDYDLNTTYWYDANGQVLAINLPGGSQVQYTYDARGNRTRETTYSAAVAWANPPSPGYVRTHTYAYDRDNRMTSDRIPAISGGTATTGTYSYGAVDDVTAYTQAPTVTAASQTFTIVSQATMTRNVDNKPSPLQVTSTFNEAGLLTQETRTGPSIPTFTTTYTYYSNRELNQNLVIGNYNSALYTSDTGTAVVYGDMVYEQTANGRKARYLYDKYGNVTKTFMPLANTYAWNGNTQLTAATHDWTVYNGFGQPIYQSLWEDQPSTGAFIQRRVAQASYYPSGEMDSSWTGSPSNVTDLTYNTTTGRVSTERRGAGFNGGVSQMRTETAYGYDTYSRVSTATVNQTNVTTTQYDTLDRPVEVVLPDYGIKRTWYSFNGSDQPSQETLTEKDGRVFLTKHQRDTLDRETLRTLPNNATVAMAYDPYDRPIAITDHSLTMLATAEDRTTFQRYDELGNLVKQLGPALVTNSPAYTDSRRPYTEYQYDAWNRQTRARVLLQGTVTPGNMVVPTGAEVADTVTEYDSFGRVSKVTDPEGYTSDTTYDSHDNATRLVRQVWKGTESGYATANSGYATTTISTAFDAMDRPVQNVDGRGNSSFTAYDLFGNVTQIKDARGIITRAFTYTPDGLLEKLLQPDNSASTNSSTDTSTHQVMEFHAYTTTAQAGSGDGTKPLTTWRAIMNTQAASGSGARTDYTYDYAARPLTVQLPADQAGQRATVVQDFDARGNMTRQVNETGFTTRWTYNEINRLATAQNEARPGSQVDLDAGLAGGLQASYTYDAAGNQTSITDRGLTTDLRYNSLGKVIHEAREHSASTTAGWRLTTYRLDGQPTAKTSYNYQGTLASAPDVTSAWDSRMSSTAGNITHSEYDRRGFQTSEVSRSPNGGWEYSKNLSVNGLGHRVFRKFWGDAAIYKGQQYANGAPTGSPNYQTFWKFDQNGNLTESWDTPANSNNDAPLDATLKQNHYTYAYSPSNQETSQTRQVLVRYQSQVTSNPLYTTYGGAQGILTGGSSATTTTTYNERDQIEKSTTTDQTPNLDGNTVPRQDQLTGTVTRHQRYSYFLDGRAQNSWTGSGSTDEGYKGVHAYDHRGREIEVYDSNGNRTNGTPAYVYTTYAANGTITRRVAQGGVDVSTTTMTPTLGTLIQKEYTVEGTDTRTATRVFSNGTAVTGLLYSAVEAASTPAGTTSTTLTTTYDGFGEIASVWNATQAKTVYSATFNGNGDMSSQSTEVGGSLTPANYVLTSRGQRIEEVGAFSNRYDADDRLTQYHALGFTPTFCGSCTGAANRYNDLRYDPYGVQVVVSTGQIEERSGTTTPDEHGVWRDWHNTYTVNGLIQGDTRRAGRFVWKWNGTAYSSLNNDTYRQNGYQLKDATYSFADGYVDDTEPGFIRPMAVRNAVETLDAPVQSLSGMLKINPLDIGRPSLPNLPDPGRISGDGVQTKDAPVQTGADQQQKAPAKVVAPTATTEPVKAKGLVLSLAVSSGTNDGEGYQQPVYALGTARVRTFSIEVTPVGVTSTCYDYCDSSSVGESLTQDYGWTASTTGELTPAEDLSYLPELQATYDNTDGLDGTDYLSTPTANTLDDATYGGESAVDSRILDAIRMRDPSYQPVDFRAMRASGQLDDQQISLSAGIEANYAAMMSGDPETRATATYVFGTFADADGANEFGTQTIYSEAMGREYNVTQVAATEYQAPQVSAGSEATDAATTLSEGLHQVVYKPQSASSLAAPTPAVAFMGPLLQAGRVLLQRALPWAGRTLAGALGMNALRNPDVALQRATAYVNGLSRSQQDAKITVLFDRATKTWHYGRSQGGIAYPLHPTVQRLVNQSTATATQTSKQTNVPLPTWSCGNCAEFNAINRAITDLTREGHRPVLAQFELYTFEIFRRGGTIRLNPYPACDWCQTLAPRVGYLWPGGK